MYYPQNRHPSPPAQPRVGASLPTPRTAFPVSVSDPVGSKDVPTEPASRNRPGARVSSTTRFTFTTDRTAGARWNSSITTRPSNINADTGSSRTTLRTAPSSRSITRAGRPAATSRMIVDLPEPRGPSIRMAGSSPTRASRTGPPLDPDVAPTPPPASPAPVMLPTTSPAAPRLTLLTAVEAPYGATVRAPESSSQAPTNTPAEAPANVRSAEANRTSGDLAGKPPPQSYQSPTSPGTTAPPTSRLGRSSGTAGGPPERLCRLQERRAGPSTAPGAVRPGPPGLPPSGMDQAA